MLEPETTPPPAGDSDSAAALLAVVDAYLEDLRQGKAPDRAAVLAAHPELAPQLESCLAALDFIHRAERPDPAVPPCLGDFRIVREIGRGAMGVVYEAEQVSLKRKVALKVLRFGAAPDEEAMARFRREAETVAALHHTNIVPLFAVGCEAGIHFFAMQLIPGRSLAAVLDDATRQGRALEAKAVVGWGVQAAEALAHAHARGVVHRDVKPSNLLLDEEGTVWLTDFGLARRRDEATLTVAGVQLGTPRYMSPEQAAAAQNPVDQRSDVYSLGASLYELATGKPVFEAPSTGQLFEQIAQAEPVPPRKHRRDLPRDLETVLLRCLAKEPTQRYPTARDLADDLRRVAAGDPVKARRPGVLLRLRRWAGRRRSSARLAGAVAVAIVATLLLVVAGQSWWQADRAARKGSVTLKLEGPAGRGEIRGADGNPAVPPFTLPTQSPLELPGGWYRLRVIRPGLLSEEYELFIEQGQQRTFTVGSNDREVWEPMPIKGTIAGDFGVLHLASEEGPQGDAVLIKRLGKPAQEYFGGSKWDNWWRENPLVPAVLWELRLKRQDDPTLAKLDDREWSKFRDGLLSFVWSRWRDPVTPAARPERQLLQPAPDLDGDGVGDLVFAFDRFVLAISGKEGKVLWCRPLHSKVFLTRTETWSLLTETEKVSLLSLSVVQSLPGVTVPLPPRIYTETRTALAGPPFVVADINRDGHPDLILAHGAFWKQGYNPVVIRPCVEALSGRNGATLWRHEPPNLAERLVVNDNKDGKSVTEKVRRGDLSPFLSGITPVTDFATFTERRTEKGRILLAGLFPGLERLDLHTGQPVAPADPLLSHIQSNGRGSPLGRRVYAWSADGKAAIVTQPGHGDGRVQGAIDTFSGVVLKEMRHPSEPGVFADLDGDGSPEMITLQGVYDGTSDRGHGWKPRWTPALIDHGQHNGQALLVGPDFDGDGCRDVFVTAVLDGERFGHPRGVKVLVGGLHSGKDGRYLWLTAEPIPPGGGSALHFREQKWREDFAGAVFYWRAAPGTAGHFVVNVEGVAFLFAADTGRLAHVWPGVTVEGVADLDGDGLLDLYGRQGDRLVSVRGTGPEVWRRPGRWCWQYLVLFPYDPAAYLTGPVAHADLDGDGVADVLLYTPSGGDRTIQAYSGRDGRLLWERQRKDDNEPALPSSPYFVECLDLEGEKRPVVVLGTQDFVECALLDGRTGKLKWSKKFRSTQDGSNEVELRPDLLYRQPDGRLALVYREYAKGTSRFTQDPRGGVLVAVDAAGKEVHRAPFPAPDEKGELSPPKGFEFRPLVSLKFQYKFSYPSEFRFHKDKQLWHFENRLWRFNWWLDRELWPSKLHEGMVVAVGWGVDPSDSALMRFDMIGEDRLTVLRKGIPSPPRAEVPTRSYAAEVFLKRPLPWLDQTRANAVTGVGCVIAYLALVAVLAAVGRRKTALLLLALFILLPAHGAPIGLSLVLVLLVAALLRANSRKKTATWACLILLLLPGALLAFYLLDRPDMRGAIWTYPALLVPLIVLVVVGWKKTALRLLIPCLLLLLYLNWPPDDVWKLRPGGYKAPNYYLNPERYLLNFSLLQPPRASGPGVDSTLYAYESWDWSGWYWLWPNQLASWALLKWALALVGGAEFVRWFIRKAKEEVP
jgi:hypothetical protein